MSSIVEPAVQDPDLLTTFRKDEVEGYREIIRANGHDPSLFLEIISRGTMKYQADDDYEAKTKADMNLEAGQSIRIGADQDMLLETGGNLTLKVGGNLTLDVQGIIDEKATQHIAGKR